MTLKTWEEEYYPSWAGDWKNTATSPSAHCLRKWTGFSHEAASKHGGELARRSIFFGEDEFFAGSSSCALCQEYLEVKIDYCKKCPLAIVRGGTPCDVRMQDEKHAPWSMAIGSGTKRDTSSMIFWLKKAVEYEENKERS